MTNLDSIFKSRDIALPTKVYLVKAMVFPLVMYGCESWTVKKAERQRIDAFELWCWRSLLMKVKEESEIKLNIQKTKIMASGPIISWEIDGETVETVSDFILGGSKINTNGDCSHEIKRCLLLGRKVMTNLDSMFFSIKKQRHYFANKGLSSQGYSFSSSHVWM